MQQHEWERLDQGDAVCLRCGQSAAWTVFECITIATEAESETAVNEVAIPITTKVSIVQELPSVAELAQIPNWNRAAFIKKWRKEHPLKYRIYQEDDTFIEVDR